MQFIYTIGILMYGFSIRLAALFNYKAKLWVRGRRNLIKNLPDNKNKQQKINWFHCASLGEFEQGRPLIERIKMLHPDEKILITFYSPSGYEIRKNYELADWVTYLPLDLKGRMTDFVEKVNPHRLFIVKYEFWFNLLSVLHEHKIPTYLISGKFRKQQIFFQEKGAWFLQRLKDGFTHFFVQDEASLQTLNVHGIDNATFAGDTRIDRVITLSKNPLQFPRLAQLLQGKKVIVAGSTWEDENAFLVQYFPSMDKDTVLIIAPHEISENAISALEKKFENVVLWSNIETATSTPKVIIINCIGILSSLYQYGTVSVIGGGFGSGIHNILEPACFGLPVIFGPKHQKFDEAGEMIQLQSGFCVNNSAEFQKILSDLLASPNVLNEIKQNQLKWLQTQSGATEKILAEIG
ncbi:MAG: 3-deoxy-D-manno-octulosonic acid transferase [Bacteroidetes bacterium]|nr:3-deoxy-D-manno-octulosonic acid transferase [Bacteroidota bacterium]